MAKSMLIFSKTDELRGYLKTARQQSATVGFVPTMGALHKGHISLISLSKTECTVTLCSIFVNPTQFNDKKDLERYPRMPEKDIALLEAAGCDVLFLPDENEIYPEPTTEIFDFGHLSTLLEGKHRPGHFNGVAQVVKRFFEIVEPDKAFFGSKDYQQVMIVRALVKQMQSPIEIVSCPILREPDGLAMSSRNSLLNAEERGLAANIPIWMQAAKKIVLEKGITPAKKFIEEKIAAHPLMKLDYFEISNADTLEPVAKLDSQKKSIALIALFVGKIRLIDNSPLN